jgi:hypothetical protein
MSARQQQVRFQSELFCNVTADHFLPVEVSMAAHRNFRHLPYDSDRLLSLFGIRE